MSDQFNIADALARAAREINSPHDLDATLHAILQAAKRAVPGVEAGISTMHRNKIETRAGTERLVWLLDSLQAQLGEGPCVDAIRADPFVVVNNLRQENRWPRYVAEAFAYGVRAQMSVRLYVEDETLGVLNLYSTGDEFDEDSLHLAELFGVHAALALGKVCREEVLSAGLQTRKVIGQAIGIVMERYAIDEDRAFRYLIRVSQHSNSKLRDVAEEIVSQGNARGGTPVPRPDEGGE